ncbi:hypothetical protein [Dysgonomonas sp. ZJ279]|uniref:hypothetical protein n=1 Tax=Dysgonomonas sp. ZJ279 TaxID=2709796 RepID=UPI0013EDB2E8|nr:hypothetical protein [Dysgonomonas sp. ZJ279]
MEKTTLSNTVFFNSKLSKEQMNNTRGGNKPSCGCGPSKPNCGDINCLGYALCEDTHDI